MQESAIYVNHYYLRFKHLKGRIVNNPEGTRYLSGGREFTKEEVSELMLGSTEPLPQEMLVGHTLATAAYIAYHHSFSDYDASVGVLDYHGEVSRQSLRRSALHHVMGGRTVVLKADRAILHLVLSGLEGRPLEPIIRTALTKKKDALHREIFISTLLEDPEYSDITMNAIGER